MDVVDMLTGYAEAGLSVLPLHNVSPKTGRCTCWPLCWRCAKAGGLRDGCTCGDRDCGKNAAKHPRTLHGKDDATTDLGQIAEWLATWPGCNWGIRPPVGVVVLDIDPRNGGDGDLAKLQAEHGDLPATLTARTGSGGLHYWFTYNGPARGKLAEGIDVKGNGGYLVAPPSIHASGGIYEWTDMRPAEYAPEWLKDLLNPPKVIRHGRRGGGIEHLVKFVLDGTPDCDRNRRLYWAACRAHESGLDTAPLLDAALKVGTPAAEAEKTVRSAERAPQRTAPRKASL